MRQPWVSIAELTGIDEMAEHFQYLFVRTLDMHAPLQEIRSKAQKVPTTGRLSGKLRRLRDNARSHRNIQHRQAKNAEKGMQKVVQARTRHCCE